MNVSKLEASKNSNIQARFETKETGTKSRNYKVTLTDNTVAHVIFSNGENLEQAKECMLIKYGAKLLHVE